MKDTLHIPANITVAMAVEAMSMYFRTVSGCSLNHSQPFIFVIT
jgi:hypothetical protein